MAAEIQINLAVRFNKSGIGDGIDLAFTADWSAAKFNRTIQVLSTVEEAINLGEATGGGGWCVLVNRGSGTDNIHIRQATGAANALTLKPGEGAVFRWSTSSTAPFAVSSAGTPSLEVIVLAA